MGEPSAAELRARYGAAMQTADAEMVMRLLGNPDVPDGLDPFAFEYTSAEACEAFAASNQQHHGWQSLGPVTGPAGRVYGVVLVGTHCPMHGASCPPS